MDSTSTLQIRDARESDLEGIKAVTLSAFQEYAASMPAEAWENYRDNMLSTIDGEGSAERIVAERDGEIVGSVLLFPAGTNVRTLPDGTVSANRFPEARLLGVSPAARGQGVGGALMRECIRRVAEAGAPVFSLHTTDMMQVAMAMYERMGFERAPELDFYPAPDVVIKGFILHLGE